MAKDTAAFMSFPRMSSRMALANLQCQWRPIHQTSVTDERVQEGCDLLCVSKWSPNTFKSDSDNYGPKYILRYTDVSRNAQLSV